MKYWKKFRKTVDVNKYIGVIRESYGYLNKNKILLLPDFIALFTTIILSFIFLAFNGLLPNILNDPSVLFKMQTNVDSLKDTLINFLGKSNFMKLLISIVAFFAARFFIGASLIAVKYDMIKKAVKNEPIKKFKEELVSNPVKYVNVILLEVFIYFFMVFLAIILTLFALLFLDITGKGFFIIIFFLSTVSSFIVRIIFFFRYSIMFLDNKKPLPAIKEAFYYFKEHPIFVFFVWLFLLGAILLFSLFISTLVFGISEIVGSVATVAIGLFILYLLKSVFDVFIYVIGDIFIFDVYSKKKK